MDRKPKLKIIKEHMCQAPHESRSTPLRRFFIVVRCH